MDRTQPCEGCNPGSIPGEVKSSIYLYYICIMKISHRTIKKIGVYAILGMFLLSTLLMSAMYFVDMQAKSADSATQAALDAANSDIQSGAVTTGTGS